MSKSLVLITGANGGLGMATVKSICEGSKPYHILVGSRSAKKGEDAIANIKSQVPNTTSTLEVLEVDIESDASIQAAFQSVSSKHGKVDALVNNAGVDIDPAARDGSLTVREVWNKTWNINVTGNYIMTETFAPLLLKSSDPRLLFVTSGTSSLVETERMDEMIFQRINAGPGPGWPKELSGHPAYRSCKTGLNMMMREWHRFLHDDGVKLFAISPGFLATGFGGLPAEMAKQFGAQDPSVGGDFIRDVLAGGRDAEEGKAIRVWPSSETQVW